MGWFEEQIKQRKISDQELFEDSFLHVASSVLGEKGGQEISDTRYISKQAIDDILKYFHKKPVAIENMMDDFDEQLDYILRPYNIMTRNIKLEDGWYHDAFGAILAFHKEDGRAIALLPKTITGYYYTDFTTGEKVSINEKTSQIFQEEAITFYRPLPLKVLGIKDLLLYLKGCINSSDIILFTFISLLLTLLGMVGPKLSKVLTGPVVQSKNTQVLIGISIFMICTALSSQLISATKTLVINRITTKSELSVSAAVMMRLLSLPANFFRRFSSGELASRASSVNTLCSLLVNTLFSSMITSLMSLLYVTQIFSFAPALLVPSLIIIISTITLSLFATFLQTQLSRKQMKLSAIENGISYSLLSGMQKIKLAGAEKRLFAKWADAFAETSKTVYSPPTFLKIQTVLLRGITLFGSIILYYLAIQSEMDPSSYFAFNASFGLVSGAFQSLATIVMSVARINPILEMAEPILKELPEVAEGKEVLTRINGAIEINHVSFRYEDNQPYVIDDLSLKIQAGEYIAIVGRTGCGKSTLIRLLLGFEQADRGAIYYDGKDIATIDLRSLRRKIGTVTQDGALFTGDIYSNIVISAPQLTLEDAWKAAEIAGIAEDIKRMPMGMHTVIGEGNGGISGGQKQRLLIARAIAPKPKILIFDEATSALDNVTQKKVSDALDTLDCTRIVVAHRLSTIKHCDRILVLDEGKIVESGTYDELIAQNGFFAELVERQRIDQSLPQK